MSKKHTNKSRQSDFLSIAATEEINTLTESGLQTDHEFPEMKSNRFDNLKSDWKRKLLYPVAGLALFTLITMGVMAKNGWLPQTDAVTGVKTGWFGAVLPKNASSSWNPVAAPLLTPTPQLSKEYIYAGSRMLAVEDANANAAPPADLAIWRPSNGQWWVLGGQGSQQTAIQWGSQYDQTAPGDYDGDGKTDFAVFRESTGEWHIVNSSAGDNSQTYYFFGLSEDKVASADYDGDGKTDPALYRASNGTWYIHKSTLNQTVAVQYITPASGDKISPADYDGDGKADPAVFRGSSNGFFYYRSSDLTVQSISFGLNGDEPVVADYDGDGKADPAVRRGSDWFIFQTSINSSIVVNSFGTSTDEAVQNDYDGDGKVDVAVWRGQPQGDPNIGVWYIRQSSNNQIRIAQWGIYDDKPVPAFYRR